MTPEGSHPEQEAEPIWCGKCGDAPATCNAEMLFSDASVSKIPVCAECWGLIQDEAYITMEEDS